MRLRILCVVVVKENVYVELGVELSVELLVEFGDREIDDTLVDPPIVARLAGDPHMGVDVGLIH